MIASAVTDADATTAAAAARAVATLARQPAPQLAPELWRLLADSHAHPQLADYGTGDDDEDGTPPATSFSAAAARETARQTLARASAARVACMSVGAGVDWARVEALAELDAGQGRVIPCFGIHPWWAHLHGGGGDDSGDGNDKEDMRSLLEAPDEGAMQAALRSVARAAAEGRLGLYGDGGGGEDGGIGGGGGEGEQQQSDGDDDYPPVAPIPRRVWEPRLRSLLHKYPHAIVGEAGLDRAASIPGCARRARCSPRHQLALLRAQLSLAAEFARPISLHCVRAHGALYEELRERALAAAAAAAGGGGGGDAMLLPPAIMLHSFGGAPEEAARFSALEKLCGRARGCRVYFSFSAAINARPPRDNSGGDGGAADGGGVDPSAIKLAARIRAVPADRLLLESDEVAPAALDQGLARSLALVAAARGWGLRETAERCRANFEAFYGGFGGEG